MIRLVIRRVIGAVLVAGALVTASISPDPPDHAKRTTGAKSTTRDTSYRTRAGVAKPG